MDLVRGVLLFSAAVILAACGADGSETTQVSPTAVPQVASTSDSPGGMEPRGSDADGSDSQGSDPASGTSCKATSRKSYEGRPLISVTEPCAGDAVTSPLTVLGEANVFEATVSMRILDENGQEIGTAFTTAECGTGCWGAFEGEIEFEVMREQVGTLQVFESSAEDGSDLHKVSIEVTLLP